MNNSQLCWTKRENNAQYFGDAKLPRRESKKTFNLTKLEYEVRIWKPVLRWNGTNTSTLQILSNINDENYRNNTVTALWVATLYCDWFAFKDPYKCICLLSSYLICKNMWRLYHSDFHGPHSCCWPPWRYSST